MERANDENSKTDVKRKAVKNFQPIKMNWCDEN